MYPSYTSLLYLLFPPYRMSRITNIDTHYTKCIEYLGIFFDSDISLHRHISHLLQQVHFQTHSLRLVRNSCYRHLHLQIIAENTYVPTGISRYALIFISITTIIYCYYTFMISMIVFFFLLLIDIFIFLFTFLLL